MVKIDLPEHPGIYVRQKVLPAKMSVTEAAQRLGVGRKALSNFLCGQTALSAELALRLENTFGVSACRLLEIQAEFERCNQRGKDILYLYTFGFF